jgi:glucose-6-phosphate dehydrogenase assembly protein OpcA
MEDALMNPDAPATTPDPPAASGPGVAVESAAAADFAADSTPVPLWNIERELSRQLSPGGQGAEQAVHRARMSNLMIFCDSEARAAQAAAQIPAIIAVHPARVLLLLGESEGKKGARDRVDAWVRTWCHRGSGGQQICTELISLRASGPGVGRLPFCVRELLLGDLPTNLWWAASQPPGFGGNMLFDLSERVEQIVYDSIGWLEPARAVAATAAWLTKFERGSGIGRRRVASDLNWRRLKYWRRLLGQALAPASAPGALESITEVLVEHGPHAVVQAWELVSWLAARLDWRVQTGRVQVGVEIDWEVVAPHGPLRVRIVRLPEGPSVVRRLRIACTLGGRVGALNVVDQDGQHLAVLPEGTDAAPRTVLVKTEGLADLAGRQLADREFDPVFHDAMEVARTLAQSVLQ